LGQHLFDGAPVAKAMEHADDKLARFRVRRDATVDRDGPFPGVIGGQDQGQIVGVAVHQRAEVVDAPVDVLGGIETIADAERGGGRWHQLHEPRGAPA
jgi:hypothetical protein